MTRIAWSGRRSVGGFTLCVLMAAMTTVPLHAAPRSAVPLPDDCSGAIPQATDNVLVAGGPGVALSALPAMAGGQIVGHIAVLHALELHYPTPRLAAAAAVILRGSPLVAWADEERVFSVLAQPSKARPNARLAPNDPLFVHQWGLNAIHAPTAWTHEVGTTNPVTAAVIDTGIDLNHPDLAGRVTAGPNFVADNTDPQDDHFHGTHVAGTIGAASDNGLGVAGVDWGVRLLAVKVMNANGQGSTCDITAGMVASVEAGVKVMNMSIGAAGACPAAFVAALSFANQRGTLAIAAAGNSGAAFNPPSAPADCAGVMGVAATDQLNKPAAFSNYGSYVTVAAPGVQILSTFIDVKKNVHAYAYLDGTSMAAPFVTGLAALLFSKHPDWTPAQVSQRIVATASDLGPKGWDPHYGAGLINVAKALS
jgi:subtilisin family serine protease